MSAQIHLDRLQAPEPVRLAAVRTCMAQLERWRIAAPPSLPLVLDFGLCDFQHTGLVELWIANEIGAGYCGKYLFLQSGQRCPEHHHQVKHETFFVLRGRVRVVLDGKECRLDPGAALPVSPGQRHGFGADESSLILELSMPCDPRDNRFQDEQVERWLRDVVGT